MESYLSLTCQFITDKRDLKFVTLSTVDMEDCHTENISDSLTLVFNNWETQNNIVTIVHGNAANVQLTGENLKM